MQAFFDVFIISSNNCQRNTKPPLSGKVARRSVTEGVKQVLHKNSI